MNRLLAETIGTFCLVFAGTGAIVVNQTTGGTITHVGIALTFGLVVLAMICTFGRVSGAHLNPAVSIAFVLAKRFPLRNLPAYIAAQLIGALAASALLRLLFPENPTLGATIPSGTLAQSFILETVLAFMLVLVIFAVAHGSEDRGPVAALAIGATVGLEAMFAGPISGASMNPARSLAPALISGHLTSVWIYIAAPIAGASLAAFTSRYLTTPSNAAPTPRSP